MSHYSFSQSNNEIFDILQDLQELNFEDALKKSHISEGPIKTKLILLTKIIEDDRQTNLKILDGRYKNLKYDESNVIDSYLFDLIIGYQYLHYTKNRQKSYKYFNSAYSNAKKLRLKELEKFSLLSILNFYRNGILQGTRDYKIFLKAYKILCSTDIDWCYYYSLKFNLLSQTVTYSEKKSALQNFYDSIFKKYDSLYIKSNNLGKLYYLYYKDKAHSIIRENPIKAREYYKKSKEYHTNSNYFRIQNYIYYSNLARVESLLGNYKKGLEYVNQSSKFTSYNDSILDVYYTHIFKANFYSKLKQYDSAYFYENSSRNLTYKINFQKENQEVSELRVELDTEKKEKENLLLKQKNQRNLLYLVLVILLLILGSVIYLLSFKNTKRKQKLAEQQKELEKHKNLTLLKEQEITTINAMIKGQEKERLRIAEDLHDNIGSVLATLKLHFQNLKLNREKKRFNQEELYQKTESLIDETYKKVRRIAHAKNSGVIANEGLLVAIQMMAEKISSADDINIEVVHFGLNKRLENSIELTVFRIVQELITNIIKHAEATSASINLSLYKKQLNIIIEDNGKGFKLDKVDLKNGMGLASIKTRIEHLKGSFSVDSTQGKGSSIIIDIPV